MLRARNSLNVVLLALLFSAVGCSSGGTTTPGTAVDAADDAGAVTDSGSVTDSGAGADVVVGDVVVGDVVVGDVADTGDSSDTHETADAQLTDVPTGPDTDAADVAAVDDAGADDAGSDVGGSDVGGSDDAGSDVGGSDVGGSDVGGPDASGPSCKGICGQEIAGAGCQCDPACVEQGDCCADWKPLCGCQANTDCDDGDACTANACDAKTGVCQFAPLKCDDANPCTADSCDKTKGCQTASNTASCDDANPCTDNDACAAGTCAGLAKTCDDGDPCTTDSCDPKSGACAATPSKDGGACIDGDPCTEKDACKAGKCAGVAVGCDDGNACTTDVCSTKTGACEQLIVADGATCDDGSACTTGDACKAGKCGGVGKNCDDGNPCTVDTCDPTTTQCAAVAAKDGAACSDFNPCTNADQCKAGACVGVGKVCDDGDPCTVDSCDKKDGACKAVAGKDGAACDDGDACTASSACQKGVCAGAVVSCDDGKPCTKDSCDPKTGKCSNSAVLEGQPCDDGQTCTENDACSKGSCSGDIKACSDGKACTADSCDPKTGACVHKALGDGAACDDGNACTSGEKCAAGACSGGKDGCGMKPVWSDMMACTSKNWAFAPDAKEPAVAWHIDATPAAPAPKTGSCTLNFNGGKDYAVALGSAQGAATSVEIALPAADYVELRFWSYADVETSNSYDKRFVEISGDGFVKVVQSVQQDNGVGKKAWLQINLPMSQWAGQKVRLRFRFDSVDATQNATTGWAVDDVTIVAGVKPASCLGVCGQKVTGASCTCDPGCAKAGNCCADFYAVCAGCKDAKDCDDGLTCTTDACTAGACTNVPVANGAPCDDGAICTVKDVCTKGHCGGVTRNCDDNNVCTWQACDPLVGCVNTPTTGAVPCDDGDVCTASDACSKGKCGAGPAKCDDKNDCTADSCDAKTGACTFAKRSDGATCSDGDPCTAGDRCFAGACLKGLAKCNDGNSCTTDSCNATSGACSTKALADGALCSDGDACSVGDVCASGKCQGKAACTFAAFYTNKVDCGSEKDWTFAPANAEPAVGWHIDGTASTPGYKSEKCSLNFNGGKDYAGTGGQQTGSAALVTTIAVPALGQPRLRFASYHGMESNNGYDKRFVEVSTDGFKTVALSVKLDNGKDASKWVDVVVDLAQFVGTSVQIRFLVDTVDGVNNTSVGWFVDDLVVEAGKIEKLACQSSEACNDGQICTIDKCALGTCVWTPATDGATCGDGNPCITDGACKAGACVGAAAKVCNDGLPCTTDACDPAKGCVFTQVANGASCDDGAVCTTKDVCTSGSCSGVPKCNDGNACTVDACDTKTGGCTAKQASDGSACNDANPCTTGEVCAKGACAAKPKDCDDGNSCTVDSCDQKDGSCKHGVAKDGAPCSDGNACSLADVCAAGKCAGKDVCTYTKLIDDTFACGKNDGWSFAPDAKEPALAWHIDGTPAGVKAHSAGCSLNYNNGTNFADGTNAVQGAATSKVVSLPQSGSARLRFWSWHGVEKNVSYDKRTIIISADGFKSDVEVVLLSNTADTANAWMQHELPLQAWLGKKVQVRFAFDSVDGIQNTTAGWFVDDVLVEVGAGASALSCNGRCGSLTVGAKCQCNVKCLTAGDCCTDYKPLCTGCADDAGCDDGNACTIDTCDKTAGTCKNTVAADGAVCDDGSQCLVDGKCAGSVCAGKAKACSDGKVCTYDACKPGQGCVFPPNAASCDDGQPCTINDTCSNGTCAGAAKPCDDKNSCTNDSCDAKTGGCAFAAKTDGAFCTDGAACTTPDACKAGKCVGVAKDCDDGLACTVDSCVAATGVCEHKAATDGAVCNDGDACTLSSSCKAGKCVGVDACQAKTVFADSFACGTTGYWVFTKPAATGDPAFDIDGTPATPKPQSCSLNFNNGKNITALSGGRVQGAATSAVITVQSGAGATLSFLSYHDTESSQSYDKRFVEISDDGFVAHVAQVQLVNNTGNKAWTSQSVDLAAWLGKSVRVRFRFDSVDGISNAGEGWFVDDVKIIAKSVLSACKVAKDCGDGGQCATVACTAGACVLTPAGKDGAACSDGDACTSGDACAKGVCVGAAKVCDDKNPCTWDACSPSTGACTAVEASDATPCGGGHACTAGKCVKPGA